MDQTVGVGTLESVGQAGHDPDYGLDIGRALEEAPVWPVEGGRR